MPTSGFDRKASSGSVGKFVSCEASKEGRTSWNVPASSYAKNTRNVIRQIVEKLKLTPNPEKPMIPLSIGDPTIFGNLSLADETLEAIKNSIESNKHNGYAHSSGQELAREAICKYVRHQGDGVTLNDIIICSGCSAAIEMCILAIAEEGQSILLPRPGFPLYKTLAESMNIDVKYYDLVPESNWEVDLVQMEALIDSKTAAILVNNPSNPCGSVFSREHLKNIVAIAERNYVPIIADEIYEHFVFPGSEHVAVSSVSENVPVLSCGGLTKRFLVPGWRLGWIVVHDRNNVLEEVTNGIKNLSTRILGANTLVQGALMDILERTPQSYFDKILDFLHSNAKLAFDILNEVPGFKPILPNGAMYMMIGIDIENFPEYRNDLHLVQELVTEQSVFCLPGSCFGIDNYVRIVLTVPEDMIKEACIRMAEFAYQHYKVDSRIIDNNLLLVGEY